MTSQDRYNSKSKSLTPVAHHSQFATRTPAPTLIFSTHLHQYQHFTQRQAHPTTVVRQRDGEKNPPPHVTLGWRCDVCRQRSFPLWKNGYKFKEKERNQSQAKWKAVNALCRFHFCCLSTLRFHFLVSSFSSLLLKCTGVCTPRCVWTWTQAFGVLRLFSSSPASRCKSNVELWAFGAGFFLLSSALSPLLQTLLPCKFPRRCDYFFGFRDYFVSNHTDRQAYSISTDKKKMSKMNTGSAVQAQDCLCYLGDVIKW